MKVIFVLFSDLFFEVGAHSNLGPPESRLAMDSRLAYLSPLSAEITGIIYHTLAEDNIYLFDLTYGGCSVCVATPVAHDVCVESVLSFHLCMASRDQSQIIRFVWQELLHAEPSH